jgi:hypothetical protein
LEREAASENKRYAKRRSEDICAWSGCGKKTGGELYCPEHTGKKVASRKELEDERKKLGLCIRDGKNAAAGQVLCQECVDSDRKSRVRKIRRRKKSGLCPNDGKKAVDGQTLCEDCNRKNAESNKSLKQRQKIEVLTHYGKDGKLQCRWPECDVTDLDMLTIDHINDDGAQDRRENGVHIYSRLIRRGFPEGFQTLCGSHQLKKRVAGLRERPDNPQAAA